MDRVAYEKTILLVFLAFTFVSFAAKTYNIIITVTDYQTDKLISGAKVSTYINKTYYYHGETDKHGQLVITAFMQNDICVSVCLWRKTRTSFIKHTIHNPYLITFA